MIVKWFAILAILCLSETQCYAERRETSNTTIKSQFDYIQHDYDVVMEIAEFPNFNRSYLKYVKGGYVPYNRTQRVLNVSGETIKDVKNVKLDIQVYKFMSNEYRFFPISVCVNVCLEYELNAFRSKELLTAFSNINPCYLKKGFYYLNNGIPDFSKFPPLIPRGRYKMLVNFTEGSDFLLEADFYGVIKDKPRVW